jgi:hypothetical protein
MVSYGGRERLTELPPEAVVVVLRSLLEIARAEQRNRASAELLCAYLERSMPHDRDAAEPETQQNLLPS